jgi:hypothetical protein
MIVVFLDPGLLTGVAYYDYDHGICIADEFDFMRTAGELEKLVTLNYFATKEKMTLGIGWETFRITAKTAQNTAAPWSLEVIGMARYLAQKNRATILPPAAPGDRLVVTDQMIKDLGLYDAVRGKKDAKSALQHLIAWQLRSNKLPDAWKEPIYGPLRG